MESISSSCPAEWIEGCGEQKGQAGLWKTDDESQKKADTGETLQGKEQVAFCVHHVLWSFSPMSCTRTCSSCCADLNTFEHRGHPLSSGLVLKWRFRKVTHRMFRKVRASFANWPTQGSSRCAEEGRSRLRIHLKTTK